MKPNFSHLKQWFIDNSKTIATLLSSLILALTLSLLGVSLSSCGSTVKALVQSPKDSATTTITITTNNPTSVSPETNVPITIPTK